MGKEPDTGWRGATSFEDRILFLFDTKQTQGEEFRTYLKIYGKDRLQEIWKKYEEKRDVK